MTDDSRQEWERRYNASIEAEDERQGRVPEKIDVIDAYHIVGALLGGAALIAVGVGFLGSKVGVPYWVGAGISLAVLASTAALGVYRRRRDRPS